MKKSLAYIFVCLLLFSCGDPDTNEYQIKGIDVSRHQGEIDWEEVSNDGISFAFIKATEGTDWKDEQFKGNWEKAKAQNIKVGAYHYFLADKDGKTQARNFVSSVLLKDGDFPPVLDLEVEKEMPAPDTVKKNIMAWVRFVEHYYGAKPILYTSPYYFNTYLREDFKDYPIWTYDYDEKPVNIVWDFWQYSKTGHVSGVYGDVDLNVYNGTKEELDDLTLHWASGDYKAGYCHKIAIDGKGDEECWKASNWSKINHLWIGPLYSEDDFSGQYKITWDSNYVYMLVEIIDDTLIDTHEDPLDNWWNDDCVEVFFDEDNGDDWHQFNHKAFAYHVSLTYDVVDIGTDSLGHLYNDHVIAKRTQEGKKHTWELAFSIYDDTYVDGSDKNVPVKLSSGKKMGFAIAYCDRDNSEERENFIGTKRVEGEDKDFGWKNAGIFGDLILK